MSSRKPHRALGVLAALAAAVSLTAAGTASAH